MSYYREDESTFYYDEEEQRILVTGENEWPSRTSVYDVDGEYITYDDSGDMCAEWCERLNCETLEEAVAIIKARNEKREYKDMNIDEAMELLKTLQGEKRKLENALNDTESDIKILKEQIAAAVLKEQNEDGDTEHTFANIIDNIGNSQGVYKVEDDAKNGDQVKIKNKPEEAYLEAEFYISGVPFKATMKEYSNYSIYGLRAEAHIVREYTIVRAVDPERNTTHVCEWQGQPPIIGEPCNVYIHECQNRHSATAIIYKIETIKATKDEMFFKQYNYELDGYADTIIPF